MTRTFFAYYAADLKAKQSNFVERSNRATLPFDINFFA